MAWAARRIDLPENYRRSAHIRIDLENPGELFQNFVGRLSELRTSATTSRPASLSSLRRSTMNCPSVCMISYIAYQHRRTYVV